MGHHLSHYKAALKAHHAAPEGTPEKAKARQVADAHMDHLFPLMHLAARAASHSKNSAAAFNIDYPNIPPWESNYRTLKRTADGKTQHNVNKLLNARTPSTAGGIASNIKDWHFLETPRHPGHSDKETMHHASGYPWEEIQLGSEADIDAKKAHLHIEDIPHKGTFTPHEFDSHPIRKIQDASEANLSDRLKEQYDVDRDNWHVGEQKKNWIARMRALPPGDFASRGGKKPNHFYDGIPLNAHRPHVNDYPNLQAQHHAAAEAATANAASPVAAQQAPQGAVTPTVRPAAVQPTPGGAAAPMVRPAQPAIRPVVRPVGKTKTEQEQLDVQTTMEAINHPSISPELRERLMNLPGMKEYALRAKGK
jgi:hypothetical protein